MPELRPKSWVLLPVLLLACAGCDVTPAKLEFVPVGTVIPDPILPNPAHRPFVLIAPVVDKRPDPESLGMCGRAFSSAQLGNWVEHELRGMASDGFVTTSKLPSDTSASITLRSRILKAYVNAISTSKTANIVLECEFVGSGGTVSTQLFRGQDQCLNWSSGEEEVKNSLKRSLARCIDLIKADLNSRLALKPN
jgi:hypothetical protein